MGSNLSTGTTDLPLQTKRTHGVRAQVQWPETVADVCTAVTRINAELDTWNLLGFTLCRAEVTSDRQFIVVTNTKDKKVSFRLGDDRERSTRFMMAMNYLSHVLEAERADNRVLFDRLLLGCLGSRHEGPGGDAAPTP